MHQILPGTKKMKPYVMTALHNAAENGNLTKTKASKLSF